MEVAQCHIRYESRTDVFRIWGIGDIHREDPQCALKELRETVKEIAGDPYSYWFGLGDYGSFINWQDVKRFDPRQVVLQASDLGKLHEVVLELVAKELDPIGTKCLGVCDGNHEETYQRHHSVSIVAKLAERWNTLYLDYSAAVRILFHDHADTHRASSLHLYLFHGSGGGALKGGKALKLARYFTSHPWADVIFSAHQHDLVALSEACTDILWPGGAARRGRFGVRKRYALMVGGFRHTHSQPGIPASYSERMGHGITAPGAVWVTFKPSTRETHAII